ncbi:MAG: hypothetical protein QNK23_10180 [Crocinitomicaceae bacterium]|nr:hypothetical protein [Crocinitomicaceae bacterium]
MKQIIPITIALLVVVIVAQFLPYYHFDENFWGAGDSDDSIMTGFDMSIGWFMMVPSFIAAVLLIVRNHVTAIIGSALYSLVFLYASLLLFSLIKFTISYDDDWVQVGYGPFVNYFGVTMMAVISIINAIKLSKKRPRKQSNEIIDEL